MLESTAGKVRGLTHDRVARWTKLVTLGTVAAVLFLLALVLVGIGLFRILAEVTWGPAGASAILGGLFLIAGGLLWWKRSPPREKQP